MAHPDLRSGFVPRHVLHYPAEGDLPVQWMIEELVRHGDRLSAGTPCRMLRAMAARGDLASEERCLCPTMCHVHRATPLGCETLELFGETLS